MGLPGDFAFDDGVNLLLNANFVFSEFDLKNIYRATFSSESGPFGRPVAMFSFAINQYLAKGMNPLGFKLTNIAIHGLNAVLLFLFLRLFFCFSQVANYFNSTQKKYLPIFAAALWVLHPLTITSVLYVIQRMTSLSASFVLLGLLAYLFLRTFELNTVVSRTRYLSWLFVLFVSVSAAALTKETALLFGFFVALIEFFFLRFSARSGHSRLAGLLVLLLVAFPLLILGVRTLLDPNWILGGYTYRPFSLEERVLTQSRLLLFYLGQIIAPNISQMGIFHDDIPLSRGLFDPITTLFSTVCCLLLLIFCIFSICSKNNLVRVFGFSISWFFVGHLLESTVFSLEIAHEHRNYFPMIGPVFFLGFLLMQSETRLLSKFRPILVFSFVVLFLFLTALRAISWQNLTDHSLAEVLNHPQSPRSQYQMGRVFLKWYEETNDPRYLSEARTSFENSIRFDWEGRSGPYFGLIFIAYQAGVAPDDSVLSALKNRLKYSKSVGVDIAFLGSLAQCQFAKKCRLPDEEFLNISQAFLENKFISSSSRADIYATIGAYYINKMNERAAAEIFFKEAAQISPSVVRHLDLAEYYRITARFSKAREQIAVAREVSRNGSMVNINKAEQRLRDSEIEFPD